MAKLKLSKKGLRRLKQKDGIILTALEKVKEQR